MKCYDCKKALTDYIAGRLKPEERPGFESHLEQCESCRLQMERLRATWESLNHLPETDPSPALRSRFYSALESAKQGTESLPQRRKGVGEILDAWLIRFWPRRPAFQASLAAGLLIVGIVVGTGFTSRIQRNGELTLLRDEVRSMRQTVTLSLLDQPSSTDRLRGVQYSTLVGQPSESLLNALLETLSSDPNVNVRLAAVEALLLFRDGKDVRESLITALSEETSPLVQIAIIDLLVQIREQRALDALRDLIDDTGSDPTVKEYARERMQELS